MLRQNSVNKNMTSIKQYVADRFGFSEVVSLVAFVVFLACFIYVCSQL